MTRAEIEADLHAGSEVAVNRAKVEPIPQDDIGAPATGRRR